MHNFTLLLILIVIFALAFDFINGFHDTANAIATVVATRVLTPRVAILMAASLNFLGAIRSTGVASTIASGLVMDATQTMILAALIGAIAWNLITWYFGIPSSSSHALFGGLVGAALAKGLAAHGSSGIIWNAMDAKHQHIGLLPKVILPLFTSPVIGFAIAFVVMKVIYLLFAKMHPRKVGRVFRGLQMCSAAAMSYMHGSNDAQKSMGIITMALVAEKIIIVKPGDTPHVPTLVIMMCAVAMALGTSAGGWRIMGTLGHKIIRLEPVHGFVAETASAITIAIADHFKSPVSTTHVISGSIFGVGAATRLRAVKWGVAQRMGLAWLLTIPSAGLVAALAFFILNGLGVK